MCKEISQGLDIKAYRLEGDCLLTILCILWSTRKWFLAVVKWKWLQKTCMVLQHRPCDCFGHSLPQFPVEDANLSANTNKPQSHRSKTASLPVKIKVACFELCCLSAVRHSVEDKQSPFSVCYTFFFMFSYRTASSRLVFADKSTSSMQTVSTSSNHSLTSQVICMFNWGMVVARGSATGLWLRP